MRADRLVAILLMLQRRERITAAEVAQELEISERTARRDLDALAMAGLPVYSLQGRGGGWRLAGGGRIDLSGLSTDETRALFLLAGPRADATPEVRSALRKLVRALPEPMRDRAEVAAGSLVIDSAGWDRPSGEPRRPPLLEPVESAVVDEVCLRIGYAGRSGSETQRLLHPLGLATKGSNWYLIADTDKGLRTFRVDRITTVERTADAVVRPEGFELSEEWQRIVARIDEMRTPMLAVGTAIADSVPYLRWTFGKRVRIDDAGGPGDRVAIAVRGASPRAIAAEIAGFGDWVRIDSPEELRGLLAEIGEQLTRCYRPR